MEDKFILGGKEFNSRFILGSGKYSVDLIDAAVKNAECEMITVALRRANTKDVANILNYIPKHVTIIPNTSGARNADEAIRIARLAREMGCGNFVKIEIMRDSKYLLPDNEETLKATKVLADEGFVVLPYMYPDLNYARDLKEAGAAAIMPLAAPIGSSKYIKKSWFKSSICIQASSSLIGLRTISFSFLIVGLSSFSSSISMLSKDSNFIDSPFLLFL